MRKGWSEVALGDIFDLDLDAVEVDVSEFYQMVGVLNYGRGLFSRSSVSGAESSYSTFYRLHPGQIVLSQLFGWEGAIAPVTPEFQGCYVSSQFPTFRPKSVLDFGFARWLIRNPVVWDQLKASAKGMGDRRRTLNPDIFLRVKLLLPPLADQQRLVTHLDVIKARLAHVQKLREEMLREVEALTTSLHLAMAGQRVVQLSQLLRLHEEQADVVPDDFYPQIGIRSFGLGLFKKSAIPGSETTYRVFNVLRPGMFVMSQVKGWEGALGVADEELDGWFASPEYRTFTCVSGECNPDYLSHLVATTWFRNQLASATRGVGARRERVRPEMLLGLDLPFPDYSKQTEAVGMLSKLKAAKSLSLHATSPQAALLPSLLDRIFNA